MRSKPELPEWPEILVGLVLLVPCALMVGFLQGQPVLQGIVGSTAGAWPASAVSPRRSACEYVRLGRSDLGRWRATGLSSRPALRS